jgi:hypothetical protein
VCDWSLRDYFHDVDNELGEGISKFLNNKSFEKALLEEDKNHNKKVIEILNWMKNTSWSEDIHNRYSNFIIDKMYDPEVFDKEPFKIDSIIKFIKL